MASAVKASAVAGSNVTNDAALGPMEPRSKAIFISVMVLNIVVAASLYLAARLQSRSALVPKSVTIKGAQSASTDQASASSQACDSTSSSIETTATEAVPAACDRQQNCQGFESSLAWRDPNIDLHISDRSMEEWAQRRRSESLIRLGGCAIVTAAVLLMEVSVGTYIGSLALISNGIHLITDVAMYGGLFFAVRASASVAHNRKYSYGLHRLEVVAVLIALVALYVMMGNIIIVAVRRLSQPIAIAAHSGPAITITATISLVVNSCLAMWVSKSCNVHSHSHVHGGIATYMARMHLVIDAVQNGIVILAGALIWIDPRLQIADTICSFIFAVLVVASTLQFFRQLLDIVMESAPEGLDIEKMFKDLCRIKHVLHAHCFHVWSISQGKLAVSVHLHIDSQVHEEVLQDAQTLLKHGYGVVHMTIQVSDDEDLA